MNQKLIDEYIQWSKDTFGDEHYLNVLMKLRSNEIWEFREAIVLKGKAEQDFAKEILKSVGPNPSDSAVFWAKEVAKKRYTEIANQEATMELLLQMLILYLLKLVMLLQYMVA